MASASSQTRTPVEWRAPTVSLGTISFPASRLIVPLYFGTALRIPTRTRKSAGWTPALRSPWYHSTSITNASFGNQSRTCGRVGPANLAIWAGLIFGSRPTNLPAFAVPCRYWPSFLEAIHLATSFRSSSDWNSSWPMELSSSSLSRRRMGIFCSLESPQKLVSVDSLLMREKPGANIPAHLSGETIPCSLSDCSAASRSARASASVWISPSR
jgi:hypothetical protein